MALEPNQCNQNRSVQIYKIEKKSEYFSGNLKILRFVFDFKPFENVKDFIFLSVKQPRFAALCCK